MLQQCKKCLGTGRTTRKLAETLTESCNECNVHDMSWQPYYDELILRWLQGKRKNGKLTLKDEQDLNELEKRLV